MKLSYELTEDHLEDYFRAMVARAQRGSPFILKAQGFLDRAFIVIGLTGLILSFFIVGGITTALSLGIVVIAVGYGLGGIFLQQRVGFGGQARAFAARNAGLGPMEVTADESGVTVEAAGYAQRVEVRHFTGATYGRATRTLHFRHMDVVIPTAELDAQDAVLPAVYDALYDPWSGE